MDVPFTDLRMEKWYMDVPFTDLRMEKWYMDVPFTDLRMEKWYTNVPRISVTAPVCAFFRGNPAFLTR
jgi:hypothetical protein